MNEGFKAEFRHPLMVKQEFILSDLQEKKEVVIFFTWNSDSDVFQSNSMFESFFGVRPKSFAEIKELVFKDDLVKLERNIRKITDQENVILSLRMKAKEAEYVWLMACFGKVGNDIILGTLEPLEQDKHLESREFDYVRRECRQLVLEEANAGLWDWDVPTGEVYFDSKYVAMLGYSPNEFEQMISSWSDRIHPADRDAIVQMQTKHIEDPAQGDSFTCKFRFLSADGGYIWIRSQGKVLKRDANGKGLRLVGLHIDITEEEEAKIQLEFMACHDLLTGLHNRNYFETNFLQIDINVLPVAYILADADALKMINDCINHSTGDLLLQKLAHALRFSVRSSDMLARIGGDEFAIFLPRTEERNARKVLKKISENIEASNKGDRGIIICASLGLACAKTMEELATLSIRADENMLEQKKKQKADSISRTEKWIESLVPRSCATYKDSRI